MVSALYSTKSFVIHATTHEDIINMETLLWNVKMKLLCYRKAERQAWASTNNSTEVELKGVGKAKKEYVSILPTMIRTFGPTFLFGASLKLFHDCLQFVSPQILRLVVGEFCHF